MGINKFEDLECWQEARKLVRLVYELTNKEKFRKDFTLRDQIRSAAISVMANIAEGFASGFTTEFKRFLDISTRSAVEVQSHGYVAIDQQYISEQEFQFLYNGSGICQKLNKGMIRYLKTCKPVYHRASKPQNQLTTEQEVGV